MLEQGPAERLGQPGLGVLPGEAVCVDEFAPCFVGGAEGDESSRALGADSVMQATECGDALDAELGSIAVTTLSLGDCAGEVGLGAGGGEQSADDVAAAFLERPGEVNLGPFASTGVVAEMTAATSSPTPACSSTRSISPVSIPRLDSSRA